MKLSEVLKSQEIFKIVNFWDIHSDPVVEKETQFVFDFRKKHGIDLDEDLFYRHFLPPDAEQMTVSEVLKAFAGNLKKAFEDKRSLILLICDESADQGAEMANQHGDLQEQVDENYECILMGLEAAGISKEEFEAFKKEGR